MGWFGNLVRAVGMGIGGCIEKVGTMIGSNTIERIGGSIKDMCTEVDTVARETGETASYDKEEGGIRDTQRINQVLSQFSLNLQTQADALEEDVLKESRVCFEYLINELRDKSEENNIKINVNGIKRELFKIEKSINGSFKNHLAKRVSLDDEECLNILKMKAGSDKEAIMKRFGNKVLKEAKEQLCNSIKECLIDQQEYIDEQMMDKMNEIILNLKDLSVKVEQFESLKQTNEGQIEVEKAKCISKLQIADIALGILE